MKKNRIGETDVAVTALSLGGASLGNLGVAISDDDATAVMAHAWDAGIRRSHAIKDMAFVPFAYESELRAYLDATPYYATEGEVAAAAAWLRRTKGAAYYRDLKALCGESRKAIYRHMDYQRKQSKPSVWLERSQG